MRSEQHPDGGIPHVIPDVEGYERSCSAAWADAACIIPWELYMAYGNKKLLREHLPMMRAWVGYVRKKAGRRYLWDSDDDRQFGDWLGLDAPAGSYIGSTDSRVIRSAFFYRSTTLTAMAAKELRYKSDDLERLASNIARAFKKEFIKDGALSSDTQTAHALTLHFGLVNDDPVLRKRLADRLASLVEERGDALATGFVGTPYLLDTLTEIGRADKAYTLLLREDFPSWLYSVNRGATTVWEHWDGIDADGKLWSADMNSFNHYAYGSVAAWIYRTALGITPTAPAYSTVCIAPHPSRALGSASAKIITRSGEIASAWRYEGDKIRYDISLSGTVKATVSLPDGQQKLHTGGTLTLYSAAND
jgi:alpha-L-rhamnosidase